jgi:4-aminobutyrate aminotransferase/(S)-3-amino-2-methylpropionate transaminase
VNEQLPQICTAVPGPRSRADAARLSRVECPEVTCLLEPPIFWERGAGANIWDVDGNRYVDLIAGFGAAALGYAHAELSEAISSQSERLQHALGDVYPAAEKLALLETLERVLPGDLGHAILSHSGSDAVESALKTALIVTGRPGVLAFEGAYHGLGFGALDATHRSEFRAPFAAVLPGRTRFVAYGDVEAARRAAREIEVGAILVEPIQGRGGLRFPPLAFLAGLRELADETGALLILDEVYTGIGRTGRWLACQHAAVAPDLVAIGKALGGGLPVSACVGRAEVMCAWPASRGEALHTSTHLGNPVTCAAANATLRVIERESLVERAASEGARWLDLLRGELAGCASVRDVRGLGLLIGVELEPPERAQRACAELLRAGWITLCEGERGDVLALTPPLNTSSEILDAAAHVLGRVLR